MNYREERDVTKLLKEEYRDGLTYLIAKMQKNAEEKRAEYISDIFTDTERYREDFRKMLGWPLTGSKLSDPPEVTEEFLAEEETHLIYRMSFEITGGVKMSGLFFKSKENGRKPLVIVQHGGCGTSEGISCFYGNTWNYNHMLERVIKYGVHAFAPQLLIWNGEEYGVQFSRADIDTRLKRLGSSVTAIEIYGITRILDYFEAKDYVGNFGMIGLSYGGFYTLFTAAAETRIKSAVSSCYFNTRDKYPWSDWTWFDAAYKFDDAEIACLVYPRRLAVQIADHDELFDHRHGEESFDKVVKYCTDAGVGTDWIDFIVFGGTHELCTDDTQIERMIEDII